MERQFTCKTLKAVFGLEKGMMPSTPMCAFRITGTPTIHITIEQSGIRIIMIKSEVEVPATDLYHILVLLEKLIMMFDGRFFSLNELNFSDSDNCTKEQLKSRENHCLINRITYFRSSGFCLYSINRLIGFHEILNEEIFVKWEKLLASLDIVHQMFIYSLCDSGLPTDVKCAFLIEMAEPLIEIVNEYRNAFSKLKPGCKGTSLKDCLKALIKEYGSVIFEDELGAACFETAFLQTLVDSRVRIMHIKHSQKKMTLNGKESVLYAVKMYLLYRCIAFDLLGIDQSSYQDNLHACILSWNEWNDIMTAFLRKLKRRNIEG